MTHADVIDLDELANDLTVTSLSRWKNGTWMELDSGNDPLFLSQVAKNSQGTVVNYMLYLPDLWYLIRFKLDTNCDCTLRG